VHSTGHGLGLEVHEDPRVARGQKTTLEPGAVITIEPGVYMAGLLEEFESKTTLQFMRIEAKS